MSGGVSSVRNIGELIALVTSIRPQSSVAATLNGVDIDRNLHGVSQSCIVHQTVGALSGGPTTTSVVTKLQHAPDNGSGAPGTYADYTVGGAVQQTAAIAAANGENSLNVDLSGANRWIRAVTTITFTGGASPSALVAADIALGGQPELPAV
jgi:hypothetical protein